MERRQAIKNLGLSFGAFVATPTALSLLQSCGPSMEPWTPVFLSEDQGKLLRKVVDGILPGVDDYPSATGANVHVFIDKYLDEVMPLEDRASIGEGLDGLLAKVLAFAEEDDMASVTQEKMDAFLNENLKKSQEDLDAMNELVGELFGSGTDPKDFPDDIKSSMLLQNIREFSIWAYKNNENVCENIMAYDPIPGTYVGCGDLQELSGGKAWPEG